MTEAASPRRYAVYYLPEPAHPLWRAGCAWLGRDADRPDRPGAPAAPEVAGPWRYGFHATLAAPMRLAAGVSGDAFRQAVAAVAARHAPFDLPALRVDALAGFIALRPARALAADHPLRRLADDCVRTLAGLRAPPTPAERARREAAGLDDAQRALMDRYGYPHVLDRWRFHLTLTDTLVAQPPARRDALRDAAATHFADALAQPLRCDALSVSVEPAPAAPFVPGERFGLCGVAG